MLHPAALLTAEESREADRATIAAGTPGKQLMEKAGSAVASLIAEIYPERACLIVCGTGNNGGDGFVVARLLKERGWTVNLSVVGDVKSITGDAELAKKAWVESGGTTPAFEPGQLKGKELVVDALFGTGLARAIEGNAAAAITAINDAKLPVVSIDIASGVHASDGAVMGTAVRATHTVTFVRPKLGQVLLPGKAHTGTLHVFDIGISGETISPGCFLNVPALWKIAFPVPSFDSHKYRRGHAMIIGGGASATGAARLAALSALRAGAGLVSVACSPESLPVYAASLISVMTKPFKDMPQLALLLEDARVTSVLIGPGCGVSETTREQVLHALSHKKACVLDADGLSAFKNNAKSLFDAIQGPTVLTPHEGEFERLFPTEGNKIIRARNAAKQSNAVVALKGNDTVIAAPDGRVAINANAPAYLATAGSGDVLAGLIAGLLAQGMPPFEAACGGVWIQGRAAAAFGPGLIAEDLPGMVPVALKELYHDDNYG